MKKEILNHKLSYFILIVGISFFMFFFFAVWPVRFLQRGIAFLLAIFYFVWGIFAHLKSGHLDKHVVKEYMSVSLLGCLLLLLITL